MELLGIMEQGAENIAQHAAQYYLNNENGMAFILQFVPALELSAQRRRAISAEGGMAPQYLICSITSRCNLHCVGCYARAEGNCSDEPQPKQLVTKEWEDVFNQARDMGVSFILLAGGEPLIRRDVLEAAAKIPTIAFPVFTNGTLFDEKYIELFDAHRNLIPVLSIEGDAKATDARRGEGIAAKIDTVLEKLQQRGILFAASVTVTHENMDKVVTQEYIQLLRERGCGLLFFIEYVPAEEGTQSLVLSQEETLRLGERVDAMKEQYADMSILSFPGDEDKTDGCVAAGRGFFHINPAGGAEPCPFSPFSVMNIREHTLREVLDSEFFGKVREISANDHSHNGGCTLFNHRSEMMTLFGNTMSAG